MMQRAIREHNIFKFFKKYASCIHQFVLFLLKVYYTIIIFQKKKLIVHVVFLNIGRDLHLILNYQNQIEKTTTKGLHIIFVEHSICVVFCLFFSFYLQYELIATFLKKKTITTTLCNDRTISRYRIVNFKLFCIQTKCNVTCQVVIVTQRSNN